MDLVLLKSFLEVARLRHFGKAAERLCVTQSAVSARIKQLEAELETPVFDRQRNDIRLTPAGQRLQKHAETLLQGWERARQEVLLAEDVSTSLAIGFPIDLWPIMVRDWTLAVHANHPDLALRLSALPHNLLVEQLVSGQLDLAILFEPPHLPEFEIRQLAAIPLVLASTHGGQDGSATEADDYIYVDWGSSFVVSHSRAHPRMSTRLQSNVGFIARDLACRLGSSVYLAEQMLEGTNLQPVRDQPLIERAAHAVFRRTHPEQGLLSELTLERGSTS